MRGKLAKELRRLALAATDGRFIETDYKARVTRKPLVLPNGQILLKSDGERIMIERYTFFVRPGTTRWTYQQLKRRVHHGA